MSKVAVYIRTHTAHAWKIDSITNMEMAQLKSDVNKGFGVETLIWEYPVQLTELPRFLSSDQEIN